MKKELIQINITDEDYCLLIESVSTGASCFNLMKQEVKAKKIRILLNEVLMCPDKAKKDLHHKRVQSFVCQTLVTETKKEAEKRKAQERKRLDDFLKPSKAYKNFLDNL